MTMIKKSIYVFQFSGPDRYTVMKILDRKLRKNYNIYGMKLIEDRKDYVKAKVQVIEDPWYPVYDTYKSMFHKCDSFSSEDTIWKIVWEQSHTKYINI